MIIIGISGHLRSGKDEVAAWLARHAGFQRLGLADALKAEVRVRLRRTLLAIYDESDYPADIPDERKLDVLLEYKPPVVRALLQEYGTEVRRVDDPDYWVAAWWRQAESLPAGSRIVVPDVRFRNEVESIAAAPARADRKRWAGASDRCYSSWVLRVVRPGADGDDHASERDLDDCQGWDAVIDNSRTLDDLRTLVAQWAASVGLVQR